MRFFIQIIVILSLATVLSAGAASREKWVKIKTPFFTILSTGTEADARQWAGELEQFRLGLQRILPAETSRLRPVTVVLFRNERALRPFKPLEKGKPKNVAGFFARIQDSQVIAISLDYEPDQVRGLIYHEAVHWYANAAEQALPPWLEEGLAEVYSTFKPAPGDRYVFGQLINDHVALLQKTKLLPLEKLTTIPHGSLEYSDTARTTLFYAQSWGFVHYLLFGEDTPGMMSVVSYLKATEKEASFATAFAEAFGTDYAEADRRLARYLKGGTYRMHSYRVPPQAKETLWPAQPAPEGEVELALGVLLLGARGERTPEVTAHLWRVAALDPGRAEVWQALGEAALQANDYEEALLDFERAVAAGSTSYYAHYGLGLTRLHGLPVIDLPLDNGAVVAAAQDFRQAIRLNPHYAPAYIALAGLLPALEKPAAGDEALLERGRLLAPDNALIDVALSVCDFKSGRRPRARQRLGIVLGTAGIPRDAQRLAAGMLKDDDWAMFGESLDRLFKERKYADAAKAIQSAAQVFPEPRYRDLLSRNLEAAQHYGRIEAAITLANSGQVAAARELLAKLGTETTNSFIQTDVRRLLLELDKMNKPRR